MTDTTAARKTAHDTSFAVLLAIGFCHLLNDMMQALLPAIYPTLKTQFHLSFAQIGLVTLAFQCHRLAAAAGGGIFRRHQAHALFAGAGHGRRPCSACWCWRWRRSYPVLLVAAMLVGLGSAVFHPESSRVARMASGGRYGLAQSVFQVGGNTGQAISPLTAALLVATYGQRSIAWYAGPGAAGHRGPVQCRHLVQASRPGAHQKPSGACKHPACRSSKVLMSHGDPAGC